MTAKECRACGAKILFIKTVAGKSIPVKEESKYYIQKANGSEKIVTPNGEVLSAELTSNPDEATDGVGWADHHGDHRHRVYLLCLSVPDRRDR